jgi:hypothetical protein
MTSPDVVCTLPIQAFNTTTFDTDDVLARGRVDDTDTTGAAEVAVESCT